MGKKEDFSMRSCRIEREAGKDREDITIDDLVSVCRKREIRTLHLMHTAEDNTIKVLDFVPRDEAHLRRILGGGERADGSSIFPNSGIKAGASDIVLRPMLATAFFDPFAAGPELCLMCQHYNHEGKPLSQSPETIVDRAFRFLKDDHGVELWAHGEIEFFLGKRKTDMDIYSTDDKGYHAMFPFVWGQDVRRQALLILAEIGVSVKYGHSECGYIPATAEDPMIWEQHEIELALEPLPKAAMSALLTEWVLRVLAYKNGMVCSFDPICREGHAGSGFHVHMSPVVRDAKTGAARHLPIRDATTHELGREARCLIAGLTQVGGALMAFGNRTDSSFVRLNQGMEAPNKVTWGDRNRHALIRLPLVALTETGEWVAPPTCEFRLGDGSAHPYYLMAGLAQAMAHGYALDKEGKAGTIVAATDCNVHGDDITGASPVPRNKTEVGAALYDSLAVFAAHDVFPDHMLKGWIESLTAKKEAFAATPSFSKSPKSGKK